MTFVFAFFVDETKNYAIAQRAKVTLKLLLFGAASVLRIIVDIKYYLPLTWAVRHLWIWCTIELRRLLKWLFFLLFDAPLVSALIPKKVIVWWAKLCRRGSCPAGCLQSSWVSHFLAIYNPRYVTEKSSAEAKSIIWIKDLPLRCYLWGLFATAVLQNCRNPRQKTVVIAWSLFWT